MAKARKVEVVTGVGTFLDPHHVEVVGEGGARKVVKFAKAIIAAASQAVKLPFMPEDERVVDSTGALLVKNIPKRMLVIGGGIIGLEMATVYSTLGTRIDVVEMLDGLMQGADRDLVKVWEKLNGASPRADAMDYVAMAADVKQLIERLGLKRPAVLGHGMGGKTAMALALMYPEHVGRLIVVDIAPVSYADTLSPFAQVMRSVDLVSAASRAEVQRRLQQLVPDPKVVPFLMQNPLTHNDRLDWRLNLIGIGAAMPALCTFPSELLGLHFRRRTTVIAGEHSNYVAQRDGSAFWPMFAQIGIDVIEKAGHWVHVDQPARFVASVRQTLAVEAHPAVAAQLP